MSKDRAARIARIAQERGVTVATAESLTGGMIATQLAAAEGASTWFRGGVVAYSTEGPSGSCSGSRQAASCRARPPSRWPTA